MPIRYVNRIRAEIPFFVGLVTLCAFLFRGDVWLTNLDDPFVAGVLFTWLFVAILWGSFGVVHHADALAKSLGEPYGTLILTLSVTGIEVALISAIMLSGEAAPTLARDTMHAVLMLTLNGLVGLAMLLGGLLHREQDYNLQGARSFIAVLLPLAVITLLLPKFTVSTDAPTFSPLQEGFFALMSLLLYAIFLGVQTVSHSGYFQEPRSNLAEIAVVSTGYKPPDSRIYHAIFLLATLLPVLLLSKRMATVVDFGMVHAGAPIALGGVVIALMVLTPEGLAALRAARHNQLQRSVNLLLGSALATIGLTVPAVLIISLLIGSPVTLGLDDASAALLLLTLVMSTITFGGVRTGVLQGAVHLVLFLAYVFLIFSP
tara:strand:+ start:11570 stop:12691 length:1122 start_codon:yes stop_codon:yes gene_type:complete